MWKQRVVELAPKRRGLHLITREILQAMPEIGDLQVGLLHLFLQHTSASLTINENADPDVRQDLESSFNEIVPESDRYIHSVEGPDDMPAHVKSSLIGCELTIPIQMGKLCLGTWQGIQIAEHRDSGTIRRIVITLWGD